ncbi:MAG: DegV family protein [Erysipelotrichaceae bacterium]|nr:DegV family protein [Erysipelotrichaceae bacterium]
MKVAYVTDTGIGEKPDYFHDSDIFVLPLQISSASSSWQDMENFSKDDCTEQLKNNQVLKTSLPSLGKIEECFEHIQKQGYEAIVAVPICSGLSGTINALHLTAKQYDIPIYIIDTHVTAIVQSYLVKKIKQWIEEKQEKEVIQKKIDEVIDSCNTLLVPYDLNHLKRGGRLTPLAAALAGLLKIKPILEINKRTQGKIDAKEKVRTFSRAMDRLLEIMKEDGVNEQYSVTFAHVDDEETAEIYRQKAIQMFPGIKSQNWRLCNVVSVHTGLKCQAVQYFKMVD